MTPLRVLVVDDEPPARQRLESLLRRERDVEVDGSFGDPRDAVAAIRAAPPDLVLLDVQMPELDGFDVVAQVGADRMPVTIFVTAFDRYALRAFEAAAVDYLLKPFDDDRFRESLARARRMVRERELGHLAERMRALLDREPGRGSEAGGARTRAPAPPPAESPPRHLERIAVDVRGRLLVLPLRSVDYISADGPYAALHVGGKVHLVRERMDVLAERLDPDRFCRIHRSTIVNMERIASLEPLFRGDHVVLLADGTRLRLSRTRRAELARRLDISL